MPVSSTPLDHVDQADPLLGINRKVIGGKQKLAQAKLSLFAASLADGSTTKGRDALILNFSFLPFELEFYYFE
jgi:hypothetical protein